MNSFSKLPILVKESDCFKVDRQDTLKILLFLQRFYIKLQELLNC